MKKQDLDQYIIGQKITDIEDIDKWTNKRVTLSNGLVFWVNGYSLTLAIRAGKMLEKKIEKKEITLLDYLRSLGVKYWYVHKRKNHYRIRIDYNVTTELHDAIASLKCKGVEITAELYKKKAQYGISSTRYTSLWIRTSIAPSEIIIS